MYSIAERTKAQFQLDNGLYKYYSLELLNKDRQDYISRLPFSIRILLESILRNYDAYEITEKHITNLLHWNTSDEGNQFTVPFKPSRVILQDLTGVPSIVDLASLRKAMVDMGGDPNTINPEIPVDLVI